MGDKSKHLERAKKLIEERIGKIERWSSIYVTKAWGMPEGSPDFLNQVVLVHTEEDAQELLKKTQRIEIELGRKIRVGDVYENRSIDIDLLYHGMRKVNLENLKLPHPRILERSFVLIPLLELLPEGKEPFSGLPIQGIIRKLGGEASDIELEN